ncbi:MAG: hypothetical protein IIX86_05150 [Clostridia bacterium]|nr:hypothetical protein [Clostridia bacterium]
MRGKSVKSPKMAFKYKYKTNALYAHVHANIDVTPEEARAQIFVLAKKGFSIIIPSLPSRTPVTDDFDARYAAWFATLSRACQDAGIKIALHPQRLIERVLCDPDERTEVLSRREYYAEQHEHLVLKLQDKPTLSLIALDEEYNLIIDLRPYVKDNVLEFDVPDGNWIIEQYTCSDTEQDGKQHATHNRLSRTAFLSYLDRLYVLCGGVQNTAIGAIYYHNLCFDSPNRRNWTRHFNQIFEEKFGYDPAKYYPILFHNLGGGTDHVRAQFMQCRADLLKGGIVRALRDFAISQHLQAIILQAEPKAPACSWITGDALSNQQYCAAGRMDHAYLYGLNSMTLASSAAADSGQTRIICEMFARFSDKHSELLALKETISVLGNGANTLIMHPHEKNMTKAVIETLHRCLYLLRGGYEVCDIAMLYPIYALHTKPLLYEQPAPDYEYPITPFTCDYMTLANSLTHYAGINLTMLHPNTLQKHCEVRAGQLFFENVKGINGFRVLVLPATSMILLDNLRTIKQFYDNGGIVIATGTLPDKAFEFLPEFEQTLLRHDGEDAATDYDREVREIVRHIFGDRACDKSVLCNIGYNTNENGGKAYLLYPSGTAADGTFMTAGEEIMRLLYRLKLPYDVIMPGMKRLENGGVFNLPLPEYRHIDTPEGVHKVGMMGHLHKINDTQHTHLLYNTTDTPYENTIYLRGALKPVQYDPQTGKIKRVRRVKYATYRSQIYTCLRVRIPSSAAIFLVSEELDHTPTLSAPLTDLQ